MATRRRRIALLVVATIMFGPADANASHIGAPSYLDCRHTRRDDPTVVEIGWYRREGAGRRLERERIQCRLNANKGGYSRWPHNVGAVLIRITLQPRGSQGAHICRAWHVVEGPTSLEMVCRHGQSAAEVQTSLAVRIDAPTWARSRRTAA